VLYDVSMKVLSGIQPSGSIHLGNYVGALRNWVREQHRDAYYCVVDLHALTSSIDPAVLTRQTHECVAALLAVGIDPEQSTLFIQSHVEYHARLNWILECVASVGELQRMTQFKDKAGEQGAHRVGFFTYPVLMASDILLYNTDRVPVGDDQRQHLELTRELAERFNARYGDTFVVPAALIPTAGARVMDLQEPTRKMSKSESSPQGTLGILDSPDDIDRKIKRAVTDTDGEVRFDRHTKPGVSNLLEIFASLTNETPNDIAAKYTRYGDLKADLSSCLIETLSPIQARYREFLSDRAATLELVKVGADRARPVAAATYERAADAIGLLR
jgi:tryptophanyl-tRNA synthetase